MNKADLKAFFDAEEVIAGIVHDKLNEYNEKYNEYCRNGAEDYSGADYCCELISMLEDISTDLCEIDDLMGQVDSMEKAHDKDAIAALRKAGF